MRQPSIYKWLSTSRTVGQSATLACLLEASAPKAGNVHPTAEFEDMQFADFVVSSTVIGNVFELAAQRGVGQLVLDAVIATQHHLDVNTNLGTLLLLAPLTKALTHWQVSNTARPSASDLRSAVADVLQGLSPLDAQLVYDAILRVKPGGLGQSKSLDIRGQVPDDLRTAMRFASEVDAVARQYVVDFEQVCGELVMWLRDCLTRGLNILDAVCEVQLRWLADNGDGLIVRKVGSEIDIQVKHLASVALRESLDTRRRGNAWQALDTFLRADGHRRNPGTTADLIAAALFVLLTTDSNELLPGPSIDDDDFR